MGVGVEGELGGEEEGEEKVEAVQQRRERRLLAVRDVVDELRLEDRAREVLLPRQGTQGRSGVVRLRGAARLPRRS